MILKSNNLASLIKKRRRELDLSQAQVQKRLGWKCQNTQYLSNIELGKCQMPAKHINRLSSAISLDRETILEAMILDYKEMVLKEINKELKS